jgi:hypothetical protein
VHRRQHEALREPGVTKPPPGGHQNGRRKARHPSGTKLPRAKSRRIRRDASPIIASRSGERQVPLRQR